MALPKEWTIIKDGREYLIAPHWVLWEESPRLCVRFTYERAMRWISGYLDQYGDAEGVPVALYVGPER